MTYLIPANAKKSMLIFGIFTRFDLILVSVGTTISLLSLMIFGPSTILWTILCLIPMLVTGFLVIPVPNYHNIRVLIMEIINFFYSRRNYKWKGWCYRDEFK